jgi:hypothetical protein
VTGYEGQEDTGIPVLRWVKKVKTLRAINDAKPGYPGNIFPGPGKIIKVKAIARHTGPALNKAGLRIPVFLKEREKRFIS